MATSSKTTSGIIPLISLEEKNPSLFFYFFISDSVDRHGSPNALFGLLLL